ncbi:MAG: bifunctional phosphopantothenoylcysteine decarboxylase/phosphopantothenate--cysteine ligase CoaBC [Pseudomonadota bacterium]
MPQPNVDTRKRILLIITGGVAAYKSLELIRRAREQGYKVRAVMTDAASAFITPLTVGAITGERVFTSLLDRAEEHDIGHIRIARDTDVVVVAPATANFMAKSAHGLADDLASTVILATHRPIIFAPAMNPAMWAHPATQRNVRELTDDGVVFVGPDAGEMAETGEAGVGRLATTDAILSAINDATTARSSDSAPVTTGDNALAGRHVLVTAGPTHEPIDPVRYIANRSSGKQGYAIAAAARDAGAHVTLISGPVRLAQPSGMDVINVQSADEMRDAVHAALPADAAIFAAAVADWKVATTASEKLKKTEDAALPTLTLAENTDILASVAKLSEKRPQLVIGFAAETTDVVANASAKRERKGCDWILANDVSAERGVFGGDHNTIHLVTSEGVTDWPKADKSEVAAKLIEHVADWFSEHTDEA